MKKILVDKKTDLKELIKDNYLDKNDGIKSIRIAEGHGVNSKNFVIKTSKKKSLFLKTITGYNEAMLRRFEIADECFRKGVKVAEIIKNKKGNLYLTKGKHLFIAFKYYTGGKFSYKREEILSAGENLARLNRSLGSQSYAIHKYGNIFNRSDIYDDLNAKELDEMRQMGRMDLFGGVALPLSQRLLSLYESVNRVIHSAKSPSQLVHLDYHLDNVIFKNGEIQAIIDYDFIVNAPLIQSVGFACDRFSKNVKDMMTFLSGYMKEDERLSLTDLELIPAYIQREALFRVNKILRLHFFHKDYRWDFDLNKQLNNFHRAGAMKDSFIRELKKRK